MPCRGNANFHQQRSHVCVHTCRYHEGALDTEMIDDVRKACLAMIEQRGEVPLSGVAAGLAAAGFQQLSHANVHEVLSTLYFDGLVRSFSYLKTLWHAAHGT
jgi:hypothetical protein